jgi:hypothetical protein
MASNRVFCRVCSAWWDVSGHVCVGPTTQHTYRNAVHGPSHTTGYCPTCMGPCSFITIKPSPGGFPNVAPSTWTAHMDIDLPKRDIELVIPDGVEPILAARSWHWDSGKQLLMSLNQGKFWPRDEPLKAECGRAGRVELTAMMPPFPAAPNLPIAQATAPTGLVMPSGAPITATYMGVDVAALVAQKAEWHRQLAELVAQHYHEAPDERCACGIYAVDSHDDLPGAYVYGTVKLWGKIIVGSRGWRAQYGQVAGIVSTEGLTKKSRHSWIKGVRNSDDPAYEVAEQYKVPVLDDWPELTKAG